MSYFVRVGPFWMIGEGEPDRCLKQKKEKEDGERNQEEPENQVDGGESLTSC